MADTRLVNSGTVPYGTRVRQEGQLEVFATAVEEFENVSARDSNAFSWTVVPVNSDDADTILMVQNTSDTLLLHILEILVLTDLNSTGATVFTIDNAAAPVGAAVTGVCWNRAAPKVAPALAKGDDTANDSQENIIFDEEIFADTPRVWDLHGALILPKNGAIGIDLTLGATALSSASIQGFFAINDALRV